MVVDKGKKQKVEENDENACIDKDLLFSIECLQAIQDELEKINEEASDKVLDVEQKYSQIRKPIYQKRNEIIQSIPDFWVTALLSHPVLGELLTEEDQKIFKFLTSIEVEDSKNVKYGYTITFNFKPNPYFEDTKLFKSYTFQEDGTTKISATNIQWKEGMAIENRAANEKEGNKRPPQEESFFSWFSDQQKDEDIEDIHDEIAELFKEDIWPDPLSYFNNQGAEDEEFEEGDDEDESDNEEEEEEGEDDLEEEE